MQLVKQNEYWKSQWELIKERSWNTSRSYLNFKAIGNPKDWEKEVYSSWNLATIYFLINLWRIKVA